MPGCVGGAFRPPYETALRLLGWATATFEEFEAKVLGIRWQEVGNRHQNGAPAAHWLLTISPRLACNVAYSMLVADLKTAQQRLAFETYLSTGELPDNDAEETGRQPDAVFRDEISQVERVIPG